MGSKDTLEPKTRIEKKGKDKKKIKVEILFIVHDVLDKLKLDKTQ